MSTLSGSNISQTYQGLLKMTNSTSGVTGTLQTVQTGDGTNTPLQISQTQVNISGSLTVNGSPISVDTGSLVTTSSFNAYTSSVDLRFDGIEIETGSLQNQINGLATTGSLNSYTLTSSFNAYTSSNNAKVNELISKTGSYVTETESGSFVTNVSQNPFVNDVLVVTKGNGSQSILTINNVASASFAQNAVSASWANNSNRNGLINTGSIGGSQSITGSLNISGTITATSASFTYVNTVYETASVIYSSGSNQLGDASNDTQTLWGTVNLPSGPLVVTGSVTATGGFVGDLTGTASFATNAVTSSISYDLVVNGKCDNPGGLTKGTIVRITGANGDNPLFNSASWTDDQNSANTLGMLSEDVAYNAFANIVVQGKVIGINTDGMTAGDMLYLSSSGTYTTSSVPAPYHEVRLGQVLRPNINNGSAYISIDNGYELSELHDVDITSPVVGDLLVYRSGSYGQWVNETGGELGFATTGSNTFTGQQNIETNLNVTQSLIVGGNSTFNGQTTYNNTIQYNADSFIKSGSQINFNIGDGQDGAYYRLSRKVNGEFGIVQDPGNLHLFDISSSYAEFLPPTYFISGAFATGSLQVRSGSLSTISNNTTININNYLTSSLGGQSNIIKGWSDAPAFAGPPSVQANFTGSLRITGSNNTVSMPQIRATGLGGGTDSQGYISGSDNMILSNNAGMYLNTGSQIFPRQIGNILTAGSAINMNFTTSSLAGTPPQIQNNLLMGGAVSLNSNSGSIQSLVGNAIIGGNIVSTQNFVTNTRPLITGNNVIGGVTLNHISSSINYQSNYNNSPITINNHLSSSINANSFNFINNAVFGGSSNLGLGVWVSGSMSSNIQRQVSDSLFGGRNIIVSSSFVSSSNSNLFSTIVYGNNLIVSGSHNVGTNGGSAYFGRFNDTGSSVDTQNTVFAVGSGTSTTTRRTSLWVGSNGVTNISGSIMLETANDATTGSLALMTARNGVQLWSYNTTTLNSSWGATNNTWQVGGSFGLVSGSANNAFYGGYAGQAFRSGSNNIMFNSTFDTFVSGSNNLFIGQANNGLAGGSSNIIIGPITYPSGSIVNNRFQINLAGGGGTVMTRDGSGAPLQIASSTQVTGSISISSVMNLTPQNPLPGGNIGDLAVSSSNQLYFYNGAWTLVV